jgi:hypothetical protein
MSVFLCGNIFAFYSTDSYQRLNRRFLELMLIIHIKLVVEFPS